MNNTVVLDLFLGDSGKGKIVDYLAQNAKAVIRFNGSNNAGHTIKVDGETYKTHCVPSGVLYSNVTNIIGQGCAINPEKLLEELAAFKNSIVFISSSAHVILPTHIETDIARESKFSIGSTKQGVAPVFSDKALRKGMRYGDFLLSPSEFQEHIIKLGLTENEIDIYKNVYNLYHKDIAKYVIKDSYKFVNLLLKQGGVVFEGAQGTYLDVDIGDYPFCTSSHTTIGAVFTGTGANPQLVKDVIGVFKAYGSYVGTSKDFPDIQDKTINDKLCELGQEYGTTTGRKRRLCWLNLDMINEACEINGVTRCVMTRLDTLEQLGVYKALYKNKEHTFSNSAKFLDFIKKHLSAPLWAIGTGPNRKDLKVL